MKTGLRQTIAQSLTPPPKMTVSEWADNFRELPSDSPEPGRWRSARVPYMRAVMNSFTQPEIKRIAVKSSSQCGKTEVLLNIIGRTAHLDPCNLMIIQPTLEMAMDVSKSRLASMIRDTKVLTSLFYEKEKTRDANQTILSKFYRGGRIVLAGANSPAGLASRPIKILLCDEVDRYQSSAGKEGDPISLAEKRTSNYWDAKVALFSTPTLEGTSRIEVEYSLGTQEEWRHQCPNCGEWHRLNKENMVVEYDSREDEVGNKFVRVKKVKWRCPDCGLEFGEKEMRAAAQKYIAQNPEALANGFRSFWINGFCSPWVSWSKIMREWLEAQGNPQREMVVTNTRFGECYRIAIKSAVEKKPDERLEQYDGEIPSGVKVLTAGVDVQGNRLHFNILGFSGEEIWGIRSGVISGEPTDLNTWHGLSAVIQRVYRKADGSGLKVARTFIDSGFSTANVYDYCRRTQNVFAIKGLGQVGIPLIHKYNPQQGKGIMLVILGVNDGKAQVFSRLDSMHFGRDDELIRNYDARFFKEMTNERRVLKRSGGTLIEVYEKISKDARNEALDTTVYALAAYQSLQTVKAERKIKQRQLDLWS